MKKLWLVVPIALMVLPIWAQAPHGILWGLAVVNLDINGNAITVDGYNMRCGTTPTGPFVKSNAALISGTTYLQTGLTTGITYYCQETAVKGTLESAPGPTSAGVLFQFPPVAPGAPSGAVQ